MERILLGDKYGLQGWRFSAYQSLLARNEALTVEEVNVLGTERVVCFLRTKRGHASRAFVYTNEDAQHQARRASYVEHLLTNQARYTDYAYNLPPSRVPESTETVVKT